MVWVFDPGTGVLITSSPAVGTDGTIYFGDAGTLYAVAPAGTNKWTFATAGYDDSSPAIAVDGTIYYSSFRDGATADGYLYAVNTNGTLKWSYFAGGGNACAGIGMDNTVYFEGFPAFLALASAGPLIWATNINGSSYASPSLGNDGSIYVCTPAPQLFYVLNHEGSVKWSIPVENGRGDSPAIGADGTVYLNVGSTYAFSPSGTIIWIYGGASYISPAIGGNGTIYNSSNTGDLIAISSSGKFKWQATTNGAFTVLPTYQGGSPAIDSLGLIYYIDAGILVCVSPNGQVQWMFNGGDSKPQATAPVIGPDGTIYATLGTKLYAIAGTNKLADTPWPMYRQNVRHTGKVEKPSLGPVQKRADASVELQLFGQASSTFSIQSSTNLTDWISFTNLLVTNLPMDFVDPDAGSPPVKFYRAAGPSQ